MSKFLYLISPEKITNHKIFLKKLELVFKSNIIKFFQLRMKNRKKEKIISIGKKIKKLTKKYKVNFIINDDPYIAKILNADGCHLGQQDMSITFAKKILKKNSIIGITCHNSKILASKAFANKASYVAFGAFYPTKTKKVKYRAKLSLIRWAKKNIKKPIVAIGGINQKNYEKILNAGANYIA
ncbi:MAG: thiamine phosphate synthase, partial [Proteobacteria bacterium]|nr:thiamine phosphate synthase [Candidatus Fonsibacter sp. PEL3]